MPTGNETTCPQAARLLVTPPDDFVSATFPTRVAPCNGGIIDVSAVQAGS